jgi:neopullulanase
MKKVVHLFFVSLISLWLSLGSLFAQIDKLRIEPPNWWAGMECSELQLMVHGEDIGFTRPVLHYPGVQLKETVMVENANYLFLNLELHPVVKPGKFTISFVKGKETVFQYTYELREREAGSANRQGFNNSDVIYLLMPDRFANGDPSNDNVRGYHEKANRKNPNGRHGGDLAGIADKLDYFEELGVSTLWLNPVQENNMPAYSYHGYAITDFYKVDARFGTNEDFRLLTKKMNERGLKMVMDMVFNHYGTGHCWMNELPMENWIHQWPEFTRSNYRGGTITDPYASEADKELMLKGWFDTSMADINQDNPFVANYLIQNSIWWIEYAGLSGIRMDTYPYSYKDFMARWMQRLHQEYPHFSVVGEAWLNVAPQVAYWQDNDRNHDGFRSHLDIVFDFPLKYAITDAFNEGNGWSTGVARLYESLSLDYLYNDPYNMVVFADNHDADRIFTCLGEDMRKLKMAMTFMMTVRGIPQIYYGTEILMTGWEHDGHGLIREDFPGGWPGDKVNAFSHEGRTAEQNDAFDFISLLTNWRKGKEVIHYGQLKHYIPEDGIYVYFRYNEDESVMVILNNNDKNKTLKTRRFAENLEGYRTGTDVLHRTYFDNLSEIGLPPMSARIIELGR